MDRKFRFARNIFGKYRWAAVAVILLAAGLVLAAVTHSSRKNKKNPDIQGLSYLSSLEKGSVDTVKGDIRKVQQEREEAEQRKILDQFQNGSVDVWSYFGNFAVLGDSRAVGFSYYGFMPEDRVFAGSGNTIQNIDDSLDALKSLNPSVIVLAYGLNDISLGISSGMWPTSEDYARAYQSQLVKLQEAVPGARIYVNSILPVQDTALSRDSSWTKIAEYSEAVGSMCRENGYGFVDCSELVTQHGDLFDPDGIHFQKDFYPYWARTILYTEVQESVQATATDSDGRGEDQ